MRRLKRAPKRPPDLVDEFDVDFICEGMNVSPEQARDAIRQGIAAGFLAIEADEHEVRLIGTFPDEQTPRSEAG